MNFKLDPDVNALYIRLKPGTIARTVQIDECVYVDIDEQRQPLGFEFVDADEFVPYLRRHAGNLDIPDVLPDIEATTPR